MNNLLKQIQTKSLQKLSANEVALLMWNIEPAKFMHRYIADMSNINQAGISDKQAFIYKDCILRANISEKGAVWLSSLPISLSGDFNNELSVIDELLTNEVYIERIPQTYFNNYMGENLSTFGKKYASLVKMEAMPQFFYKSPECLDYSGGSKKAFRKILNDAQYTGLKVEYVTSDNITDSHRFIVNAMTEKWKRDYRKLHTERGSKFVYVSTELADAYKKINTLTSVPNNWLLLILYQGDVPIIFSITEKINPSYVQLTLGKNNLDYKSAYPEIARYIFMLETKYWSTQEGMHSEIIFNGGDGGIVLKSRDKDDKGKYINNWEFNKPDSYIYKDSLCYHKRTLRPYDVTASVTLGKGGWLEKAKKQHTVEKPAKKGIF